MKPNIPSESACDARRIVLVGTGTGVGKTHAAQAITAALVALGKTALGLKPIESGFIQAQSDAWALAALSSFPPEPAPYRFTESLSPHLAARRAGLPIDFACIDAWLHAHAAAFFVLETAGGLLTPLGQKQSNLDWVRHLKPEVLLLVGVDRLGVLHELSACCIALRVLAPDVPKPWVILQPPETPDPSTGSNAEEIQTLGIARVAATFPRTSPNAPEVLQIATQILRQTCFT